MNLLYNVERPLFRATHHLASNARTLMFLHSLEELAVYFPLLLHPVIAVGALLRTTRDAIPHMVGYFRVHPLANFWVEQIAKAMYWVHFHLLKDHAVFSRRLRWALMRYIILTLDRVKKRPNLRETNPIPFLKRTIFA